MATQPHIYSAESKTRHLKGVFKAMALGMVNSRYMAYRLFLKDVKAEYAKSAFGLLWDFIDPLVLGCVFYFLKRASVINAGDIAIPYPVFVVYGLLLYQTFVDSVTLPLDVMRRSRVMLTHLNIAPEALVLSVFFRVLFISYFRIIVMLAFSLALQSFSLVGFVKFLLCYPLIVLAGMSIGIFLAPFNAIYKDVGRATRIILFPLRYATPVFYQIPNVAPFSLLFILNPVALLLTNLRSLATQGFFMDVPGLVARCCFFAGLFLVGWLVFHLAVPILAERA